MGAEESSHLWFFVVISTASVPASAEETSWRQVEGMVISPPSPSCNAATLSGTARSTAGSGIVRVCEHGVRMELFYHSDIVKGCVRVRCAPLCNP